MVEIIAKLMIKAGFLFIFLEKTKQKFVFLSNRFAYLALNADTPVAKA